MNQYLEAVKKGGDYWKVYLENDKLRNACYLNTLTPDTRDYYIMRHETWVTKNYPDRQRFGYNVFGKI